MKRTPPRVGLRGARGIMTVRDAGNSDVGCSKGANAALREIKLVSTVGACFSRTGDVKCDKEVFSNAGVSLDEGERRRRTWRVAAIRDSVMGRNDDK